MKRITPYIIAVLLTLLKTSGLLAADAAYLLLAAYASCGPKAFIESMLLLWFFNLGNPAVFPIAPNAGELRFLILAAGLAGIVVRGRGLLRGDSMQQTTLVLAFLLCVHSFLFSFYPLVSLLKSISWSSTMLCLYVAWKTQSQRNLRNTSKYVTNMLSILVIASVPTLFIPSIGYFKNGYGFQGILNQPQVFGPTCAILAAAITGKMLDTRSLRPTQVGLLVTCLLFTVFSQSRTALAAYFITLLLAFLAFPVVSRRAAAVIVSTVRSPIFGIIFLAGTILGISALAGFNEWARSYWGKGSGAASVLQAYSEGSRGAFAWKMITNIYENPITGIGFGVASNPATMKVVLDPFLGLPVMASVEKGTAFLAIIEELGIPLAFIVFLYFGIIVSRSTATAASLMTVTACLLTNFGEATLFSPGGFGLLTLILITESSATPTATARCTTTRLPQRVFIRSSTVSLVTAEK